MPKPYHLTPALYDALGLSNEDIGLIVENKVLSHTIAEFAKAECASVRGMYQSIEDFLKFIHSPDFGRKGRRSHPIIPQDPKHRRSERRLIKKVEHRVKEAVAKSSATRNRILGQQKRRKREAAAKKVAKKKARKK